MSALALALVLLAAILHASWNAMVKANGDRAIVLAGVAFVHFAGGTIIAILAPMPAPESWPFIIASAIIHYFYYALIFFAYRWGDLSHVYPISRGIAPALVSLGAWMFVGETLTPLGWAGVATVSLGILFLTAGKRIAGTDPRALFAALTTGVVIAFYSVVDGVGVRLSGSPMGYIGWLFASEVLVTAFVLARRRKTLPSVHNKLIWVGLLGGVFSAAAYGLVIFAATIAPLGGISAVRESSVIIAALIGVFMFGERPMAKRLIAAVIVAAGVLMLAA